MADFKWFRNLFVVRLYLIVYLTLNFVSLQDRFAGVDIRIKVKGGGHVAQVYAIRQSIAKALVAYYQKCKCTSPFST